MKTLIIYATHHGTIEKIIEILEEKIENSVSVNIKKEKIEDIKIYDAILIGGSIHVGNIQKKIKNFCVENLDELKQKRVGLFLCCMFEGEKAEEQFENAYPEELRNHAIAKGLFGGELLMNKMNFIEKIAVKKAANVTESVSKINYDAIEEFIQNIKK